MLSLSEASSKRNWKIKPMNQITSALKLVLLSWIEGYTEMFITYKFLILRAMGLKSSRQYKNITTNK